MNANDIEFIDKDWDKHAHLLFRFSNSENVGLPFKYKKNTKWGNSFTRDEIISNIHKSIKNHYDTSGSVYIIQITLKGTAPLSGYVIMYF